MWISLGPAEFAYIGRYSANIQMESEHKAASAVDGVWHLFPTKGIFLRWNLGGRAADWYCWDIDVLAGLVEITLIIEWFGGAKMSAL